MLAAVRSAVLAAVLVLVSSPVPGAELDLRVAHFEPPETLPVAAETVLEVMLENTGETPWDPEAGYAVAVHILGEDGEPLLWDGPRTELPFVVHPGQRVRLAARAATPSVTGPARLQWDVVQEGVRWLSGVSATPPPAYPVRLVQTHAFTVVAAASPGWPQTGDTLGLEVTVRNDGVLAWRPGQGFALAAHWRDPERERTLWEGERTDVRTVVPPGGLVTLEGRARVPDAPGRWLLQWDMVQEGVCWFSRRQLQAPPEFVVVVLPPQSEAWPAWGAAILVLALAVAGRRGWWPLRRWRGGELLWLVLVPLAAIATVVAARPAAHVISAVLLAALAAALGCLAGWWRRVAAVVVGTGVFWLILADRLYLRFFGDLPSLGSIGAAGQAGRLGESVGHLVGPADLALLAVVPTLWAVAVLGGPVRGRPLWPWWVSLPALLAAGCAIEVAASRPEAAQVFRRAALAESVGVPAAHLLDLRHHVVAALTPPLSPAARGELVRWFQARRDQRVGAGPHFAVAEGLNLVMIEAESLQHFVVGLEIGGDEVTPTLNRWARQGVWFTRITDQTGHGRSSDAELLTQTSLLPRSDGAAAFLDADNRFTSLAGELAARGYATLSAVPFDRTFWNRQHTHPAYGYERNLFAEDFEPGHEIGWGLDDREFAAQMGARIEVLPEPFAVWMLTLSLHHPFSGFPDELQELDVGVWEGMPVGEYLHTMRYLDRAVADLEGLLEEAGLLQRTVIAVWGDHDAGFVWRPEVAELMGVTPDAAGWYRSQRIPLVIRAPSALGLSARSDRPGGHVDVAPTLAALFGIDPGPLAWMGRNLLAAGATDPVVGEYGCWMTEDLLFLQGRGDLVSGECLGLPGLRPRPLDACAAGFQTARTRTMVADEVLRHDLQAEITAALGGAR